MPALLLAALLASFAPPAVAQTPARAMAPATPRTVTLEQAIRLALDHDPAAVAAEASVSRAQADLLQSRGAFLPSLQVNGIYGNSSNERFDQTTGRLVSQSYTAQLQGSYEIFSGGRRLVQHRAAGADLDAADARYTAQRFNTTRATTEAFYAAAAAADLLAAAEQRLTRAEQQLDFAETRLEIGTATRSDVLRAGIERGNAELAVLEASSGLRAASLELGRMIGLADEVLPEGDPLPDRAPALPPLETLVERVTRSSPAVLAAEATAASRRADRLAAWTPLLPTVRLSGGYDWFAFEFPPEQQSWSLRLFATMPVFNGFQREAAIQRAAADERTAEATARDAVLAARVDVETAVQEIEVAEQRVSVADRSVELAREDLRVQEERYQIGAATILDLQTSQVSLADAEVAAVRARQGLGSAVARLEAVLGAPIGEE